MPPYGWVGKYRVINPLNALKKLGHKVKFVITSVPYRELERFDVVVFCRQRGFDIEVGTMFTQKSGGKVIFDTDDNEVFVPTWNPFHKEFYVDGLKKPDFVQQFRNMRSANVVTCSTEQLQKDMRWFNEKVVVLRNQIVREEWEDVVPLQTNEKWIGFFGSNTHKKSFQMIVNPLTKILREKDVRLVICGYPDARDMFPIDVKNKILTRAFQFNNSFKEWMKACKVIVRSATDDRFTLSKSENPVLEASACGVPILVNENVYGRFVREAGCPELVCKKDEWYPKLEELVLGESKIGARLQEWVFTERTYEKHAHEWEEAYSL